MEPETTKKVSLWARIKTWFSHIFLTTLNFLKKLPPGGKAWRGAALGMGILGYLVIIVLARYVFLPAGWGYFLAVLVVFPIAYGLAVFLTVQLGRLIFRLPVLLLCALGFSIMLTMTGFGFFDLAGIMTSFAVIVLGALLGAGLWALIVIGWGSLTAWQRGFSLGMVALGGAGIILALVWLLLPGEHTPLAETVLAEHQLPQLSSELDDPSEPGTYSVLTLTYGSGTDKRRPEFAEDAALITDSVDGSDFIGGWTDLRTFLWGFDSTELPINGRVWYPDGAGPFPLVLVVHGNHLAEEYSDPGYRYLCDLLASRGSICVSVDENFLNGSGVADFFGFRSLGDENDLRGILLLEHLVVWAEWGQQANNPFYGKVDMDTIALIGHSRGGEAVAVASAFNGLDHYPDDATIVFDYGFGIRSIVAIAPVDRQYRPSGETIPLQDVNYLVLHGSHDMDVTSFDGYNAFDRLQFSGEGFFFKTSVFAGWANHGQFNTVWGDADISPPPIWLYNRGQLIPALEQQRIAEIYISAFLEASLHGRMAYLPLFQNYQKGLDWLPKTVYINAYGDSHMTYFATFEEDLDVTTGTVDRVRISAEGLDIWREDRVWTKWGSMHSNSAVFLGWDGAARGQTYTLRLPEGIPDLTCNDSLVFSAAQTRKTFGDAEDPQPADFVIELVDSSGRVAALPLSFIAPLQPAVEANLYKLSFLNADAVSEPVFQTYLFPLEAFLGENPDLNLPGLYQIRLVFNQTDGGEILLDNIGFRKAASDSTGQ